MRETGVVVWFSKPRGFGFLRTSKGDVFVHWTGIADLPNGQKNLITDQLVGFDRKRNLRGKEIAVNVRIVGDGVR